MTGRVTTLVTITNSAPGGFSLKVTDQQKDKSTTIESGKNGKVSWGVPWYNGINTWSNRYLLFAFSGGPDGSDCSAAVWQHGAGGDILWEQGDDQPSNPSTGTPLSGVQEGANFNLTVAVNVPPNSGDPYTVSLTASL